MLLASNISLYLVFYIYFSSLGYGKLLNLQFLFPSISFVYKYVHLFSDSWDGILEQPF